MTKNTEEAKPKRRLEAATAVEPDDHIARMRRLAAGRLDRLFDEAIGARFYGKVMIEISFEGGRPVRRRLSLRSMIDRCAAG